MNQYKLKLNLELTIHLFFWLLVFTTINVKWNTNWFDVSLRPKSPAPLSVLILPVMIYLNAFWAIPKFLSSKTWLSYTFWFVNIFILPELLRSGLMVNFGDHNLFWKELMSRDSFIFGAPSIFWIALMLSFGYRFSKDWFIGKNKIAKLETTIDQLNQKRQDSEIKPLAADEAQKLSIRLEELMEQDKLFLNPKLSLRMLARQLEITDKKLSILLNQNMDTNFYDFINQYRVAKFKQEVSNEALNTLSMIGLATQCGFSSKSSFYRAFRKITGQTPTAYLTQHKTQ